MQRIGLEDHPTYGQRFTVSFPYDEGVKNALRSMVRTTIFDAENRRWVVPLKMSDGLDVFAADYDFEWEAEALSAFRAHHDEAAALRELHEWNVTASSEPVSDYAADYTSRSGKKLYPFQRAGVEYVVRNKRTFLADEQGLGKTPQALVAIEYLGAYPTLIICPASLKLNWRKEAHEWLPEGKVVAVGPKESPAGADVYIINYDMLSRGDLADELMTYDWGSVVCDEAHALKNRESKRTRAVCGFFDRSKKQFQPGLMQKSDVRVMITGTPMPNRPNELIQPLNGLGRMREFGGFSRFASTYCGWREGAPGSIMGAQNLDELNLNLRKYCYVRRKKQDVLPDLPDKTYAHVPMSIDNRRDYEHAKRDIVDYLGKNPGAYHEALVKLTTLRKLAAEGKSMAAVEWIRDFTDGGEKLVVMAWHKAVVETLMNSFGDKAVCVVGGLSAEEKQAAVDRFQNDPECTIFVGNIQAAGTGLTLTAASNIVFLELPWTPAELDQATDRVHRIGQTRGVNVYYLLAESTIDEGIAGLIDRKRRVTKEGSDGVAMTQEEAITYVMKTL